MKVNFYLFFFLLSLLSFGFRAEASHLRGGYIHYTVDQQNPLKVYFTMNMYTAQSSPGEDPQVTISMGNGITKVVDRESVTPVAMPNTDLETFKWEYTFPSAGTHTVYWDGVYRNGNILNLSASSGLTPLILATEVKLNPLGPNYNGVQVKLQAPVMAYHGEPLRFNLLAFDLDGDSLGYELIAPLHLDSEKMIAPAPDYTTPAGFGINRFGEIYWEKPDALGEYAFAVRITQYRNNQPVGYTVFDLQLYVLSERDAQPAFRLENKDALAVTKDGQVLVKPGEKVSLQLHFPGNAIKTWLSYLPEHGISDASLRSISPILSEFSFTATEQLIRNWPHGINFYYTYPSSSPNSYFDSKTIQIYTLPIRVWQPEPVELVLVKPKGVSSTADGDISSTPGNPVKLTLFARKGLGHNIGLAVESNLSNGAKSFRFTTRDSAESVVGELYFEPSENQISSTPYTITARSTSSQLGPGSTSPQTQELTFRVLVGANRPTSSGEERTTGQVKLHPNPVKDKLVIEAPDLPSLSLQLYHNGKTVATYQLKPGQNRIIRPASLAHGLYLYILTSRHQLISSGKLVLQ